MDDRLNISWKRPAQPNDYTLNYTVSVTDISTGTELNRTVLNETQIIVTLPHTPCMYTMCYKYCALIHFSVKGVPLNVTVFATNGRGNGESVSEEAYVEEDGIIV